ncbi:MAG TPA: type II secretion system F family protein [Opitutaceae bacterium]|nr:type II secretion system F family protein [Opitutaceae bacterium]
MTHNASVSSLGSEHRRSFTWSSYAFEVNRRPGRVSASTPVRPRRICVYAPSLEAATAGAGVSPDETYRAIAIRPLEPWFNRSWPDRQEIADFYETVGSALMTGCGMTAALNLAARIAHSPRMRGIVGTIHHLVMHGEELHVAMRRFPRVFSPMQLAMVEAAAATGLDKAGGLLVTLSARLQRDGRIWRKFLAALAYPASVLLLTIIGAIVLEIWALPPMVELFRTLGGRLPPITRGFYAAAQFLRLNAAVLLPLVVVIAAAVASAAPRLLRTGLVQRSIVRVWVIGPVVQWLALVRALGTFVLLKQSGAKVRDQFALASAAAGNCVVGGFFDACYNRIALGESVEEAFTAERHRLGEDGLRIAGRMEIGMAGADLPLLLNHIIDEIGDRAEVRLNLLPNMIRWPLMIVCCAIIGVVALAIVLPYPNLIADVAHQQASGGT